MAYKKRDKKRKTCYCCQNPFYGYANKKCCSSWCSYVWRKYGTYDCHPKFIKQYEKKRKRGEVV